MTLLLAAVESAPKKPRKPRKKRVPKKTVEQQVVEAAVKDNQEKVEKMSDKSYAQEALENALQHDAIHHPDHYTWRGMECIEMIKAFVLKQTVGFYAVCEANILKYLYRWQRKNRLQDLKKAREYLDMLIRDVEENGVRDDGTGIYGSDERPLYGKIRDVE